jgi:3-isopropylmalate/(R)-2-methylmalate dehydratase large subunit
MGMTIAEKIIAHAAHVPEAHAGEIHTVTLDRLMSNDGTTHLTIDMYRSKLKHPHVADPSKVVFIIDHNVPSDSAKTAAVHKKMHEFAKEQGIVIYDGQGVCHQIMMEKYVRPGELIFGADSHTTSYGALGAFGTGVGCTDFLYAMVTGTSWLLTPSTLRFNLHGSLRPGVTARDLILTIIGDISASGASYKVMEFAGDGAHALSIDERMVLCNLTVEAGAKAGIVEPDEKCTAWCRDHGRDAGTLYVSDADAVFEKVYDYDLDKIVPVAVRPDFVDNFATAEEVEKEHIAVDEVFVGSCNNGRLADLQAAADVVRGRHVAPGVRFLVSPASQDVYVAAMEDGTISTLVAAGAQIMNPNCSVCWGSCQGVLGAGEVLITTGTRNFKGRSGDKTSKVYMGSAYTCAASAIAGYITAAH